MSWDGIYRAQTHYARKEEGQQVARAICGRRFARNKTSKQKSVTCFACLKKLGVIK